MKGTVTENILAYMNSMGKKTFTYIQVSKIAEAITQEYFERKAEGSSINVKSRKGKRQLNERIAAIANQGLNNLVTAEDVHLYKVCRAEEYSNRTGRCAFGFKDTRKRLGYDPETGYEVAI